MFGIRIGFDNAIRPEEVVGPTRGRQMKCRVLPDNYTLIMDGRPDEPLNACAAWLTAYPVRGSALLLKEDCSEGEAAFVAATLVGLVGDIQKNLEHVLS